MKKRSAQNLNRQNKDINQQLQKTKTDMSDVCEKLLKNENLTLENISLLAHRIAETENYTKDQLIVCGIDNLHEQLNSRKTLDLENKPIFGICAFKNEDASKAVFGFLKLSNEKEFICLYKDFFNNKVPDDIKMIIEQHFGPEIEFKVSFKSNEIENKHDQDILSLQILKTMMTKLKGNEKTNFLKDFSNSRRSYFGWFKGKVKILKDELFSLIKEGYYKTLASDIDQLSIDTEFKKAVKELINSIPLLDQVDNFKHYQKLLKEFVALEESEHDDDIIKKKMKEIEIARGIAFAKTKDINIKMYNTSDNKQELDIIKKFPNQMAKFTKIFEPLARAEIDDNLDKELKNISDKLDLDFVKLKSFFQVKEKFSEESTETHLRTRNIQEVISDLPNLRVRSTIDTQSKNKSFEQLMKEIELSELKSDYLVDGYEKVKSFYASWKSKDAYTINQWSIAKKGRLNVSEIFEAVAVIDRANELVTGGHTLRDTQILSILCFLQQNDKGMLSQISTGEGKTTIVAVLAAIKVLLGEFVDVITSNPILAVEAVKDKKLFFEMLDISVATNNLDPEYTSGERDCYKADIVYGNISNYQFDFLKDSFLGLGTRADRPFDCIILDEVDSMIIDNASHIAKLAGPLPGMESLKYIYIKIWQELLKAEEIIIEDFQKQLKAKAVELNAQSMDEDEAQAIYENFENMLKCSIFTRMADHIKASNPTNIQIIPSHLRAYADNTLDKWINSAINARYVYDEDEQYVIRLDTKSNEKVVQPIDYANTGVTLKNTIWQYGLHQFLQLKHNLHLTSENLTSCFISNLGYINKYGNKIFGLTGTLGSKAEQELLSSIYNVSFAKIPTYKEKKFIETEGDVVPDEIFHFKVANDAADEVSKGRSSLIICETIKDAKAIVKILEENFHSINTRTFFDETHAQVTEKEINPCEVVIATNIAGRGTDFKTTIELESNGGLQVCVAFLPCNKRVEDQAFGRTARQGNNGTAKLVIKKSEIEKLGINTSNFEMIKFIRDLKEAERIKQIKEVKIIELTFQDELFEKFSALFKDLKDSDQNKIEHRYVLDDLKEYWAFWLEKSNFKGAELKEIKVEEEFNKFKMEANDMINGHIKYNPYNSIQQTEHFITVEKFDEAEKAVDHALAICENSEILHSAYIKLFEISIERGRVLTDKFRKALGDLIYFGDITEINPDREYKQKAKIYLNQAISAFKKELEYIEELCKTDEFTKILVSDNSSTESITSETKTNQEKNLFLKHIISKQVALDLNIQHANSLIQQIDAHRGGITINCRINDYYSNIKPDDEDMNSRLIQESVNKSEWAELAAIGTNTTYALREVFDVPDEILTAAKLQIGGGMALLATGMCFPPALPATSSIGGTMITEGVCDVAIELINKSSDGQFHQTAFIKGKVISYGISLLTMGISAALQCPKILEKAKKACRWLSATLRKCPYLKSACEFFATKLDKLGNWFEKLETLAKFNQMNKLEKLKYVEDLKKSKDLKTIGYLGENIQQFTGLMQELQQFGQLTELTHFQTCISTLQQVAVTVGVGVTKRCVEHVIMSKIVTPALSSLMEDLKPKIKSHVSEAVNENIDKEKLKYYSYDDIQNVIKEIRDTIDLETVKDIFKETLLAMTKYCSNWKVQLGALAFDQFDSWQKVYNYAKELCLKINSKLKPTAESIKNDTEMIVKQLVEQFTDEMYNQLVSTTIKTCRDVYSVGKSAFSNYQRDKRLRDLCLEINKVFKEGGVAGQEQARAASDVIKRRIEIHEENGNVIIIGEQYAGEPVKVNFFPPDDQNPDGHYVPYGQDKNWSIPGDLMENNCLFDALAVQIEKDPVALRKDTIQKLESDPANYIAPHARNIFELQLFLEGGRKPNKMTNDIYPSFNGRIQVSHKLEPILKDLHKILKDEYEFCEEFDDKTASDQLRHLKNNKSVPSAPYKDEMMMGVLYVEFTNGQKLKLVTVSGDNPLSFRKSMTQNPDGTFTECAIPFKPQTGAANKSKGEVAGYKFVDPGKPDGKKIYDVYNRKVTDEKYTKSCAAQKLHYALAEHMKANPNLKINGNIQMAESYFERSKPSRVVIEDSCRDCKTTLPTVTGSKVNDY